MNARISQIKAQKLREGIALSAAQTA